MINFLPQLPILQTAPAGGGGGQMLSLVVTFGVIIAIFYFLVIRPQSKKRKESRKPCRCPNLTEIQRLRGVHGRQDKAQKKRIDINWTNIYNLSRI